MIIKSFFRNRNVVDASTNSCSKLMYAWDDCESCEEIIEEIEMESLSVLCEMALNNLYSDPSYWSPFKRFFGQHKLMKPMTRNITLKLRTTISDDICFKFDEKFSDGHYIFPCKNLESFLAPKWAIGLSNILMDIKLNKYGTENYEKVLILGIYYKACITYQLFTDNPNSIIFSESWNIVIKKARKCNYEINYSTYLKVNTITTHEKWLIVFIKSIMYELQCLGISLRAPFDDKSMIDMEIFAKITKYNIKLADWPKDLLHNEFTSYLPSSIPFSDEKYGSN